MRTDNIEIKTAIGLNENISEKISKLFVEAFGEHLKAFSKDTNRLVKAFTHIFILDYFYICIIDNEVAGMIVCIDKEHYCLNPKLKILIQHLGLIKGLITYFMFKKFFNKNPKYPIEVDYKTGSIEFVATSEKYRNKGIASSIMKYIFSQNKYDKYILEVADTNEKAVHLYQKLGFNEVHRIKQNLPKSVGINYFVYMVKE
jgi:ribosomal protein S18 acetylase RimI-like enzyme